jgi:hypothetical protein
MFGGQIIGQCLAAALGTVVRHAWPVSVQLYFIAAPEAGTDIVYRVEKRRDGGRYAWRHVLATQRDSVVAEAIAAFSSHPAEAAEPQQPLDIPIPDDRDGPLWPDAPHVEHISTYFSHVTMGTLDVRFVEGSPARRLSAKGPYRRPDGGGARFRVCPGPPDRVHCEPAGPGAVLTDRLQSASLPPVRRYGGSAAMQAGLADPLARRWRTSR